MQQHINERLLRRRTVLSITGKSNTQLYRDIRNGKFPAPVKIGERASAWLESEVDAWIAARIAASRTPKAA